MSEKQPTRLRRFAAKTGELYKHADARVEKAVINTLSRLGSSGTIYDETMSPHATEAYPALTPISKPEEKSARLLYDYAYEEIHEEHPQRGLTQELFNGRGIISGLRHNETTSVPGMIDLDANGSITSGPITKVFKQQAIDTALSKDPGKIPAISPTLKAVMRVTK